MALILVKPLLLFYFLLLTVVFSTPLHFKTLILKSLPIPHRVTPADEMEIGDTAVSFQLHHIDSLISLNATPESLFNLRLQRDAKRANSLFSAVRRGGNGGFTTSVISGTDPEIGEYFARLGVGTPPSYSYMVLDTGSDVTWIQCSPCMECYNQTDQIFNPATSTSYSPIACDSDRCRQLNMSGTGTAGCDRRRNSCLYLVHYADESVTVGDFATETLTFGKTRIPNVSFGCGHLNHGLFSGEAAGLLGLGRSDVSIPSQINNKFSYCLFERSSFTKPSTLVFGNSAVSRKARYTPLLTNPNPILKTFYYVDLLGFSVGGNRVLGISPQMLRFDSEGNGGVMIDSGTSITRLTDQAYDRLSNVFGYVMRSRLRMPMITFRLFDTCFDLSPMKTVDVPDVVMHFTKVDVSLPPDNYFIPVHGRIYCLAFAPSSEKMSIIGNIQQQGFRIIYDLAGSRIGFSKYDATCNNNI